MMIRKAREKQIDRYLKAFKECGLKVKTYPSNGQINVTDVDGVIQTYCTSNGRMLLRNKNGQDYYTKDNNYNPPFSYPIDIFALIVMYPVIRKKAIAEQSVKPFKEYGIKNKQIERYW